LAAEKVHSTGAGVVADAAGAKESVVRSAPNTATIAAATRRLGGRRPTGPADVVSVFCESILPTNFDISTSRRAAVSCGTERGWSSPLKSH